MQDFPYVILARMHLFPNNTCIHNFHSMHDRPLILSKIKIYTLIETTCLIYPRYGRWKWYTKGIYKIKGHAYGELLEIHGTLGSKDIRRYAILSTIYEELMEIYMMLGSMKKNTYIRLVSYCGYIIPVIFLNVLNICGYMIPSILKIFTLSRKFLYGRYILFPQKNGHYILITG